MEQIKRVLSGRIPNRIILTIYLCLIFVAFIDVYVTDDVRILAVGTAAFAIVVYLISGFILDHISCIKMKTKDSDRAAGRNRLKTFIIFAGITLAVMLLWFAGYCPGSFQGDCLSQVRQAMTGKYSDWHPVWQTLLIYTIPLKITGGWFGSMTFFQMIWFSLAAGYMCTVMEAHAGRPATVLAWAYIVLNPYTGQMMLYPWKDSAFAIAGLVSMTMTAQIIFGDDNWKTGWIRFVLFGIMLANTSLFRHNAILFTIPLIIALLFNMERRHWCKVVVSFIAFMLLIKVPVYNLLDVYREPQSVVQAVGLPMNIIANVAKETPELLDEETADFIYKIAPQETWESKYQLGNFGVIKYYCDINEQIIEDTGTIPIHIMGLKCFAYSPGPAVRAFFATTDIVYGIDILDRGHIGTQIETNDLGIHEQGNNAIANMLEIYYKIVRLHGFNYFRQTAFSLLLILVFALSVYHLNLWKDWKKILLILPVFSYAFGTMLLLTSPDSRFFYIIYPICPVILMLIIADNNTASEKVK